ncbi:hypothetical protein FRC00_009032 [Tulasnella sp. 408]|nr:hypothetical protein FRC00_009032 [Tulasnella sp. 408]
MSSTSLSVRRRVIGTAALGVFLCIVFVVSQTTKSKWWLLALLAFFPISIAALAIDRYVRRSEFVDSAAELPLPVVAIRRTRAPGTTVTALLRAWHPLPIPSAQGLYTIASRYTTVFDRTLSRSYLFNNVFTRLVDVRFAPSPETRAWIVTVLNGLRDREAVVPTLQRLASPLEPRLVLDRRLAPVERLVIDQLQDLVSPPCIPSALGEHPQAKASSTETLSTSRATSPANTTSLDTKRSAALASTIPSIVLTPAGQTTSEVLFDLTSGYVDDKTKGLEPARNPSDTGHSTVSFASSVSGRVPYTSSLDISSVPFPSLTGPAEDDERTIANAGSLVPKLDVKNALGIVLSDPAGGIVSGLSLLGRAKSVPAFMFFAALRCALDAVSVPFKRSRKVALKGPNTINCAEWRRNSLDDVAAAVAREGDTITLPQLMDTPISTPVLSSDDGKLSSTTSSWPTPTPSTPPTSIDLQPDHQCGAGTPNCTLDSKLQSPNDAQVLDTEATVREAPEGKVEETVAWWRQDVPSKDVQSSRRSRHRRRRFGHDALKSPADEDLKWAKTEGKKPVGGRRPLMVPKPASPTTLIASDAVDDERGEGGFEEEELQKAILMSMGLVPEDGEADAEASLTSKQFDGQLVGVPLEPPPPYSPSESQVYVDKGGFPVSDLEKALQESMSVVQTTVPTMGEEDDLDKDGFSKSQQQQAREASRGAIAMPFYGATTSHALQPLSEEEWALLEEFEATSSN